MKFKNKIITIYSSAEPPAFSQYISVKTLINFSVCPDSDKYFGVSAQNMRRIPRISAGIAQATRNRFHERKKK